jgi:hypothetical protein
MDCIYERFIGRSSDINSHSFSLFSHPLKHSYVSVTLDKNVIPYFINTLIPLADLLHISFRQVAECFYHRKVCE